MDDLALASQVKATLIDAYPAIAVTSDYGNVLIYTKGDDRLVKKLEGKVKSLLAEIEGLNSLEIHPGGKIPPQAI